MLIISIFGPNKHFLLSEKIKIYIGWIFRRMVSIRTKHFVAMYYDVVHILDK